MQCCKPPTDPTCSVSGALMVVFVRNYSPSAPCENRVMLNVMLLAGTVADCQYYSKL